MIENMINIGDEYEITGNCGKAICGSGYSEGFAVRSERKRLSGGQQICGDLGVRAFSYAGRPGRVR